MTLAKPRCGCGERTAQSSKLCWECRNEKRVLEGLKPLQKRMVTRTNRRTSNALGHFCRLCDRPWNAHRKDCKWNPAKVRKIEREIEVRYQAPQIEAKPGASKVWGEKERRKRELNRFLCSRGHDFVTNMPRETAFCVENGCRDKTLTHVEVVMGVTAATLVVTQEALTPLPPPVPEPKFCSVCNAPMSKNRDRTGMCRKCGKTASRRKNRALKKSLSKSYELNQGKAGEDSGPCAAGDGNRVGADRVPGVDRVAGGNGIDEGPEDQRSGQHHEAAV